MNKSICYLILTHVFHNVKLEKTENKPDHQLQQRVPLAPTSKQY